MQQNLCEPVRMPNIDAEAKAWELDLSSQVGRAVLARRKALGLSAVQLAARTNDLGYPITRVTISRIENNARAGKVDVAELLILAAALEMPPVLLVFPDFPYGEARPIPGPDSFGWEAVRWMSGEAVLPPTVDLDGTLRAQPSNPGVDFIREVTNLNDHRQFLMALVNADQFGIAPDELEDMKRRYSADGARIRQAIDEARLKLWGDSALGLLGEAVE